MTNSAEGEGGGGGGGGGGRSVSPSRTESASKFCPGQNPLTILSGGTMFRGEGEGGGGGGSIISYDTGSEQRKSHSSPARNNGK